MSALDSITLILYELLTLLKFVMRLIDWHYHIPSAIGMGHFVDDFYGNANKAVGRSKLGERCIVKNVFNVYYYIIFNVHNCTFEMLIEVLS